MPVAAARRISASAAGSKLAENLGGVRAVLSGLGCVAAVMLNMLLHCRHGSCRACAPCCRRGVVWRQSCTMCSCTVEMEVAGPWAGAVELERRRIDPGVAGLVQ